MIALILTVILGVPACPSEGSAPTVCVWDASEQGNGLGQDFLALGQFTRIMLPQVADLTLEA